MDTEYYKEVLGHWDDDREPVCGCCEVVMEDVCPECEEAKCEYCACETCGYGEE